MWVATSRASWTREGCRGDTIGCSAKVLLVTMATCGTTSRARDGTSKPSAQSSSFLAGVSANSSPSRPYRLQTLRQNLHGVTQLASDRKLGIIRKLLTAHPLSSDDLAQHPQVEGRLGLNTISLRNSSAHQASPGVSLGGCYTAH